MKLHIMIRILSGLLLATTLSAFAQAPAVIPENRITSVYVSEDFINEQIATHLKGSNLFKKMKVVLDPDKEQIFLRGDLQVPVEELRAVNLDPKLGLFHFQVTIKPETTKHGHLILEFPLSETYFYSAESKDSLQERVIVPVQLLSLGLASARGYLAALSGDFSGVDRRTEKLNALIKGINRLIASEKNADAVEDLKSQRQALQLQLQAVPIERRQLQTVAKEVSHILGFTGEKELNLNNELGARKNALILKIKLSQLVPYLQGVELGGVRIRHDKNDGAGENYLVIDVNSELAATAAQTIAMRPAPRPGMKVAPSLIVRLNQSLFESVSVVDAENKSMPSKLKDFGIQLKDDGLHVSGSYKTFFFSLPFDTIVDFVTTGTDVFEVRVRELKVGGINFEFLSQFVLETVKSRLDVTLKDICSFNYIGEVKDHSRALQVIVRPAAIVPAFPDLHLVGVDVREREFLLKIGHP
jgi:hypothetical protein